MSVAAVARGDLSGQIGTANENTGRRICNIQITYGWGCKARYCKELTSMGRSGLKKPGLSSKFDKDSRIDFIDGK